MLLWFTDTPNEKLLQSKFPLPGSKTRSFAGNADSSSATDIKRKLLQFYRYIRTWNWQNWKKVWLNMNAKYYMTLCRKFESQQLTFDTVLCFSLKKWSCLKTAPWKMPNTKFISEIISLHCAEVFTATSKWCHYWRSFQTCLRNNC